MFCRIRPTFPLEKKTEHLSVLEKSVKVSKLFDSANGKKPKNYEFKFDEVFGPFATQQIVFDVCVCVRNEIITKKRNNLCVLITPLIEVDESSMDKKGEEYVPSKNKWSIHKKK